MVYHYVLPDELLRAMHLLVEKKREYGGVITFCANVDSNRFVACGYEVNGGTIKSLNLRGKFCAAYHTHPAPCGTKLGCSYFAPSAIDMRTYAEQASGEAGLHVNYLFSKEGITTVVSPAGGSVADPALVERRMYALQSFYWEDPKQWTMSRFQQQFKTEALSLGFHVTITKWSAKQVEVRTNTACRGVAPRAPSSASPPGPAAYSGSRPSRRTRTSRAPLRRPPQ